MKTGVAGISRIVLSSWDAFWLVHETPRVLEDSHEEGIDSA
jgi:hypothetical protein